jgi:hypothetical protein
MAKRIVTAVSDQVCDLIEVGVLIGTVALTSIARHGFRPCGAVPSRDAA